MKKIILILVLLGFCGKGFSQEHLGPSPYPGSGQTISVPGCQPLPPFSGVDVGNRL